MAADSLHHPTHPVHRRPGRTLYWYVAREALRPALFALLGLTAVVLTKDLMGFSDLVINRGLGVGAVASIALYKAVPIASTMFPFAALVGALVALGRLGADREILVLEASGVAATRLVWPVVSFAGVMTVVALALSLVAAPWASRSQDRALEEMSRKKPWTQIRAGKVNRFGGWQLEAREVSSRGDRLEGVLLWIPEVGETIFSRSAQLSTSPEGAIRVAMIDGSVLLTARSEPRQLRFRELTTTLPDSDAPLERADEDRLASLPLDELLLLARNWQPTEENPIPREAIKLHRRIALPFATLIFGFLAVPLFLVRTNFSRSSGGVMGLLCTIGYYGLVHVGEGLVHSGQIGIVAGVWFPNAVLAVLAIVLFWKALRGGVLGHAFDRPRARGREARHPSRGAADPRPRRYSMGRYVARRFAEMAVMSFAVLLVAYFLIDLMERFEWFARYQATTLEAARFYGARIWLLASRVVPMALLVGTALTVSLMAAEGELIGLRSCGVPASRALAPVLLVSALVAPAYFGLSDVIVPRTNALADFLKQTEIKDEFYARLKERRQRSKVWYRSGDRLVEADLFDTQNGVARDLTVYELGKDGLPTSRTDALAARHIGQGRWRLEGPVRLEVNNGTIAGVEASGYADLGEAVPAKVDTMHLPVAALAEEARQVEADGYDATSLWVDLHVKLAAPFACLVLPALVLFFAVAGPPFPGPAQTILVSAVLAVGSILLTGVFASIGYGGVLPPVLAGWAPTIVFAALAGFFGVRVLRGL